MIPRPPCRLPAALAVALTMLAACAAEAPAPADPAQATAPAAVTAAPAVPDARIKLAQCQTSDPDRVHFQIGTIKLAAASNSIRDVVPAGLSTPTTPEAITQELRARASAGGGCPESPLKATLVLLEQDLGDPLLTGNLGLLQGPPGAITGAFANATRALQEKPTKNCRDMGGGLLGCVGRETRGDRATDVLYLVTTDRKEKLATGGPLAARCVLRGERVAGCNLVDELEGGVVFDADLAAGTYTTEALRRAHRAVTARIAALRL